MKWFFYIVEVTFAIISGISESYIYAAYLPDGGLAWPEALARATITQVAIVLFGVAAVNAYQAARGGFRGFLAALPANVLTLIFASVAVWFTRESALMFEHKAALSVAQNQAVSFQGVTLDGHAIDPLLIAALPLFQVALNWLAPLIVTSVVTETEEERAARFAREEQEAEHKRKMRTAGIAGLAGAFKAGVDGVRGQKEEVEAPAFAAVSQEESPAESTTLVASEPAPLSLKIRGKWWDAPSFKQFVFFAYGIGISDDTALKIVREIGNDQRASERVGRPFIAGMVKLKNEAKRLYASTQAPAIAGNFSPEMAE